MGGDGGEEEEEKEAEEEAAGAELKTKTPHIDVGNDLCQIQWLCQSV